MFGFGPNPNPANCGAVRYYDIDASLSHCEYTGHVLHDAYNTALSLLARLPKYRNRRIGEDTENAG